MSSGLPPDRLALALCAVRWSLATGGQVDWGPAEPASCDRLSEVRGGEGRLFMPALDHGVASGVGMVSL